MKTFAQHYNLMYLWKTPKIQTQQTTKLKTNSPCSHLRAMQEILHIFLTQTVSFSCGGKTTVYHSGLQSLLSPHGSRRSEGFKSNKDATLVLQCAQAQIATCMDCDFNLDCLLLTCFCLHPEQAHLKSWPFIYSLYTKFCWIKHISLF